MRSTSSAAISAARVVTGGVADSRAITPGTMAGLQQETRDAVERGVDHLEVVLAAASWASHLGLAGPSGRPAPEDSGRECQRR